MRGERPTITPGHGFLNTRRFVLEISSFGHFPMLETPKGAALSQRVGGCIAGYGVAQCRAFPSSPRAAICGKDRIRSVLNEVAEVLETMVEQTIDLMNQGASLNDIIHSVSVRSELLEKPYLGPPMTSPSSL